MKTSIKSVLIIICLSTLFIGCKKTDSSSVSPANLQSGKNWQITYYYDSSKDETYKFNSYSFEFKDDGTLVANGSGISTTGVWSINSNNSRMSISLGSASPLDNLSSDWLIISQTNTKIKLRDDHSLKLEEVHFSLL